MIGSLMSRMEDAQKLSIPQLQKSIQDGVLPAYIGIPLLQDKIKQAQSAQAPQVPQQPPIAQQVLQQAKQIESGMIPQQPMPPQPQMAQPPQQPPQMAQQMPQGIDSAESNLPTEMAEGGIVGFADGGVPIELHGTADVSGQSGNAFGGQQGGFNGYGSGYKGYGSGVQDRVGSAGGSNMFEKPQQLQKETSPMGPTDLNALYPFKPLQQEVRDVSPANVGSPAYRGMQVGQSQYLPYMQHDMQHDIQFPVGDSMGGQDGNYRLQGTREEDMSAVIGPKFTGFAKGGPVGYAKGILIDDEDDDIDPTEDFRTASKMFARDPMEQRRESASILGMGDSIRPMLSSFTQPISDFASGIKSKFINKTPEVDTVTKPQVQPEGGIPGIIASKAQKYNLPPQLMSSIAKAESNFNPNAGNKTGSSAKGLYQFIDKTWTGMGGKPGEQFDPEMNSELGAKYIRQNAEFLKNKLGRDPSYSEVYAAHYFGPSGASNLLTRASPKDSIEKGLATFNDPKGVRLIMKQNPNLKGKTVGQVLNDLERKTGSGIVSLAQGGQIKHFQVGGKAGMLFSDPMGGMPYEDFNKPAPMTATEIRKNQEIARKAREAVEKGKNAAKIGPPKPLSANPAGITSALPVNPSTVTPFANPALASMKSANTTTPFVAPTIPVQNANAGIKAVAPSANASMYNIINPNAGPKPIVSQNPLKGLGGGGGDANTYPGGSDINTYLELQEVIKKYPNDPKLQSGMEELLRRNPTLPKAAADAQKRYTDFKAQNPNSWSDRLASMLGISGGFPNANSSTPTSTEAVNRADVLKQNVAQAGQDTVGEITKLPPKTSVNTPVTTPLKTPLKTPVNTNNTPIESRESANARALIESGKNDQARRDALFADYGDTSSNEDTELGANVTQQMSNMPTQPTTKEEEKKPYSFEDYLADMQAKRGEIKGKKDEDKYMSLLAAGLGMMSGTSQFAGANIGKGALAGVQDYRDTQKQRAAELAAVDKEIGSGLYRKTVGDYYSSNILSKDEKAKRDQLALNEKIENNAAMQYKYITAQINDQVENELAVLQKSLGGQLMSPEKIALESKRIRRELELKNKPMIDNLLKKMNMPNINLESAPTGNRTINFNDIK